MEALAVIHDWYVPPLVFLTFKELYYMIKPIHRGSTMTTGSSWRTGGCSA
ncbi:MAG: hypothetical protein IPI01_16575 [Ignavibacteriae bacterium]|nr:hypothetical protein [Ignavibacteriota bacterium]